MPDTGDTISEETTVVRWDSAFEAIERCYELGWTDGLPVVPPTEQRVGEFIERSGRPASDVVGELPERRREITVGKIAANAVMAGCLPEYMPVVVTATEAMLEPVFNLVGPSSSMGGSAILSIRIMRWAFGLWLASGICRDISDTPTSGKAAFSDGNSGSRRKLAKAMSVRITTSSRRGTRQKVSKAVLASCRGP